MKTFLEPWEVELLEENAKTYDRRQLEWVPCVMYQLLIRFLFRLGCRVSEALAVVVEDVDLDSRTVKLLQLKERLRLYCPNCGVRLGRAHQFCPGCGRKVEAAEKRLQESRRQRILPLDKSTAAMLRELIDHGVPVAKDGRRLLFPIGRNQARHIIVLAAKRAGLGPLTNPETGKEHGVSPHRLRDAFATHALSIDSSTEALRLLQEQLGHKSISQTMRYTKITGKEQRDWYNKLFKE